MKKEESVRTIERVESVCLCIESIDRGESVCLCIESEERECLCAGI